MKAITLRLEGKELVTKRKLLISQGYAVVYYPALWGGNAHPKNRAWCVLGPKDDDIDYDSLRVAERKLKEKGQRYVIIRTRRRGTKPPTN